MNYRVLISEPASDDILSATQWYEKKRNGLGMEFTLHVEVCLSRIAQNPTQYQALSHNKRGALVNRFPYRIIYIIDGINVVVIAVMHTSRNPSIWKNRR
jgi:toxin ParE1/3/4